MPRDYVYLGIDPKTGKEDRKYFTYTTPRDKQRKREAILIQHAAGRLAARQARFSEFSGLWLESAYPAHKTNPNTLRMYTANVRNLTAEFGAMKMDQIRSIHIEQYINSRPPAAAKQELMTLKQICKSARKNHYLAEDPTEDLEVQYTTPPKRELAAFERDAIMKAQLRPDERAFISLAFRCGLRKGEILALSPGDITDKVRVYKAAVVEQKGMVINDKPKTRAGDRSVPIPADVRDAIQAYAITRPEGEPLFGWFSRTRFWRFWHHIRSQVNDAAGGESHYDGNKKYRVLDRVVLLPQFSPHILRHTYCSDLIRAGYRVDEVMYLMGHSSPVMTLKIYNQVKHGELTSARLERKIVPYRSVQLRGSKSVNRT